MTCHFIDEVFVVSICENIENIIRKKFCNASHYRQCGKHDNGKRSGIVERPSDIERKAVPKDRHKSLERCYNHVDDILGYAFVIEEEKKDVENAEKSKEADHDPFKRKKESGSIGRKQNGRQGKRNQRNQVQ